MRWLVAVCLLAATTSCQLLVYHSDVYGHYVPVNESSGSDCALDQQRPVSFFLPVLELEDEGLSLEDEDSGEIMTSRWGDCGVGGVARLAGELAALRGGSPQFTAVTAGNILGDGRWELPANFSAAVIAATQFDVMGLGPGEFLRGVPFLGEFLSAVNATTKTNILACNVKSSLLGGLVKPSVVLNGVLFVGVVDPAIAETYISFDSDIQVSSVSCIQDEISKNGKNGTLPVVVVGSAASLNSSVINVNNVAAFVLSGLSESDKGKVLQGQLPEANANKTVLVTEGYGQTVGIFNISGPSDAERNITTLNSTAPEDGATANATASLQQRVADFYASPVESYFELTSSGCNRSECSVGDVICDSALIGSLLDGRVTKQPIAVWPGQNLTGKIPKGDLSVSQLYSILPSDRIAIANASGSTVIKLFSRAVQDMTVDASSSQTFLQVSGVRVTYDLDLPQQYRAKYLMNLCLTCSPQEYLPVSESSNYTIALPVYMLDHPSWKDLSSEFTSVHLTGFTARDAVSAKVQLTGRLLAPVGDRIDFTHIAPDVDPTTDTFVAVLSTVVVCMVVFGLGVFGFTVWSRHQNQFGSTTGLLR